MRSFYENWLFNVQRQYQLHVLTCIIELRCDSKTFDALLQIDYDIFSLFVYSFWLFNSSSFFVCHFFLACQLTCLSPLQSNHFNAGKKCHIHSESREWNVNQINKHRQILIWSEILLVFVINFVLVEQKLRSLNFSVSYFHLNSQMLHFFYSNFEKNNNYL